MKTATMQRVCKKRGTAQTGSPGFRALTESKCDIVLKKVARVRGREEREEETARRPFETDEKRGPSISSLSRGEVAESRRMTRRMEDVVGTVKGGRDRQKASSEGPNKRKKNL